MEKRIKKSGRLLPIIAVAVFVLLLAACQPQVAEVETSTPTPEATETAVPDGAPFVLEGAETTTSGLQYLELETGDGPSPQVGDIVSLQYIITLPDGTEIANSYFESSVPSTVWGLNRLLPGWEEAIGMMNVGGKSKAVLPPDLAFGEQGAGAIPPNTPIVIEMELLSAEPSPVPTEVAAADMTTTESGLEYYDITEGTGDEAVQNSGVSTHYAVWVRTDSGYEFIGQSEDEMTVDFVVGRGDTVFPGWEEGVTGMREGGRRLLVVPPDLAMGAQGSGLIPPNAVLVMEVELTDVREPQTATEVDEGDYTTTDSGLKYFDITTGTGETPEAGQGVLVHYTGWLEDGTVFDSSVERGQPFNFILGQGNVIPGWDEGVATMQVGGKRQLVIPAELAYGTEGAGGVIPPGATLIFEVELLDILN
jgi:peptidylprolyl isomerase